MGDMKRAITWEDQERRKQRDRFTSTITIAASIVSIRATTSFLLRAGRDELVS
jgi:hypothetical protein